MATGTLSLLSRRRFLPLFVTQFLSAANDNMFKNALIIFVVFGPAGATTMSPAVLATVATALFIVSTFLFGALAGQVADRFEKSRLFIVLKLIEIVITAFGSWALIAGNVSMMLTMLFLLGVQATFIGPVKYAILPEYLAVDELIGGGALIEGGTFLAILGGTLYGGLLVPLPHGTLIVSAAMMALAVYGFFAALFMPKAHPANPAARVSANLWRETAHIMRLTRQRRDVFLAILGISWFWLTGATFLSQFPAFAKDTLHQDQHTVTLMLTVFSVGVGLGSLLCSRLLKGEISARFVPWAMIGITLFTLDLFRVSSAAVPPPSGHVMADLLAIAMCGGLYIVPLYAIVQSRSAEATRSQTIAGNNIMNALFMVAAAGVSAAMLVAGLSVIDIFLAVGVANLLAALYARRVLRDMDTTEMPS